ncbi:MAG: cytosine permease, partial [Verrucomicrobia bacterium]|nr:cytosine permease [Verrucomicrobiota bacterium]
MPERKTGEDFPLSEIPPALRRDFWSNAVVLLGFTFFTATMWGGGKLGTGLPFRSMLWTVGAGNLLLGLYVAVLGLAAQRSGLNSVLMARYSFGDWGSKLTDLLLGVTQIGWYAWGTATIAIMFVKLLGLPAGFEKPLMVVFGLLFCWTAYFGYRGLEALSIVAVPMMTILIFWSIGRATNDIGGWAKLWGVTPSQPISIREAITIVFGTFVSGGTQATNWTRFARTGKIALGASLMAFFIGNGLMIFSGAYGALVYQQPDIVEVLRLQGLLGWGLLMLILNIWTTQDNTIYNFSVAGCNLFRTSRRQALTFGGAILGTILAILGMYNWLVPWLILLGTIVPPVGGILMADFWLVHRGVFPSLARVRFRTFNWAGLATYALACVISFKAPGIPPLNGILAGLVLYPMMMHVFSKLGYAQGV